jgi:hypothetical protein
MEPAAEDHNHANIETEAEDHNNQNNSINRSSLELPADIWHKIVDQLPTPSPILPCVKIYKTSKKKWTVNASKGCTEDEVKYIFGGCVDANIQTPGVWYHYFDCQYDNVRHYLSSLIARGFVDESSKVDPRGDLGPMRDFFFLVRRNE